MVVVPADHADDYMDKAIFLVENLVDFGIFVN